MKNPGQKPRPTPVGHQSQLPIVRITIDDAVLVLGVLELVGAGLEPDSELGVLVERSAARVAARLEALTDSLSPVVGPGPGAVVRGPVGPDPRASSPGAPPGEHRTPA